MKLSSGRFCAFRFGFRRGPVSCVGETKDISFDDIVDRRDIMVGVCGSF